MSGYYDGKPPWEAQGKRGDGYDVLDPRLFRDVPRDPPLTSESIWNQMQVDKPQFLMTEDEKSAAQKQMMDFLNTREQEEKVRQAAVWKEQAYDESFPPEYRARVGRKWLREFPGSQQTASEMMRLIKALEEGVE